MYDYHILHADEKPLLVNKDGRPAGSKSYVWVHRTGQFYERPIILYEYQRIRNASHHRGFLKDFLGVCLTDGYQVYHTIEKEREDLKVAGCYAHVRRKYDEALKVVLDDPDVPWITTVPTFDPKFLHRQEELRNDRYCFRCKGQCDHL